MFCPKCGKENPNGTKFCTHCGADFENIGVVIGNPPPLNTPRDPMTFGQSISTCLSKYIDFNGRASRPEYWWFSLFTVLMSWGAMVVDNTETLSTFINLALLLPSLAAGARRLHDTNRSGWWQLLMLTIIGIIPVVIWLASKGNDQKKSLW
jgi:hypothetical protein